jgi:hypothetical protein
MGVFRIVPRIVPTSPHLPVFSARGRDGVAEKVVVACGRKSFGQ